MRSIFAIILKIITFISCFYCYQSEVRNVDVSQDAIYNSDIIVGSTDSYNFIIAKRDTVQVLAKVENTTLEDKPVFLSISYGAHTVSLVLPYKEEGKLHYSARYTVCCIRLLDNQTEEVDVILLTHSVYYISYQIEFTTVDYLFLEEGTVTPPLLLSYSSPLLLYYSPLNNSSHLNLKVTSEEVYCIRGEIYRDGSPPVPGSQLSRSIEQFLMRKFAYLPLKEWNVNENNDFFLVLKLVSPNTCKVATSMENRNPQIKLNVSVMIEKDFENNIWLKIFLFPCLFLPMYFIFFVIYLFEKFCHLKNPKFAFIFLTPVISEENSHLLSRRNDIEVKKRDFQEAFEELSWNLETEKRLSDLSKNYFGKKYMRFVWGLCSICLFYNIPALQSTLLKQKIALQEGDLDFCFYNARCALHLGELYAFNNVWSNIGFVLLGVLFMLIVAVRYKGDRMRAERGVDRYVGLELALGLSMVSEGFMSALYHACPNAGNYKYDTLFMLVSLLLIILQLYTNRHAHSNLSSHTFILLIGIFTCLSLLDAFESTRLLYYIRSIYILLVVLITITLLLNLYYIGNASFILSTIEDLITRKQTLYRVFWPKHNTHRVVHILFVWVINLCGACCFLFVPKLETGTIFVGIFVGNFFLYLCYYWAMKLIKREYRYNTAVCMVTFSLGLVSSVIWSIAFSVYSHPVSNWALGPVVSKEMNKECVMWGYYDTHDMWHILSAYALFFTYLSVIKTDDNVATVRKEQLSVF